MQTMPFARPTPGQFAVATLAMAAVVLASNILVQFALNDWLTWGAFTYPVAYLVSDLVNRRFGPGMARRVAWVGFAVAIVASLMLAPMRIALASGLAFIASQLLDIRVFDRLRRGLWWRAPLVATVIAAVLDSIVFWGVAFAGTDGPWLTWAAGDLAVKLGVGVLMLLPFRLLIGRQAARTSSPIRITRGDDFQSLNVRGLYPAGEGASYAGGILSAGVDGIKVAEAVARSVLGTAV